MDYEGLSTDDELDDIDMIGYFNFLYPVQKKTYFERQNPFDDYSEEKFKERFRLRKSTVLMLLAEVEDQLEYVSDKNQSISPINQLLITLRYFATGSILLIVGDTFGVSKSTACRVVNKVSRVIASLSKMYIKFPSRDAERQSKITEFYLSSGMPGIIGAIDGTHVPIQSPGGEDAEIFRNRKGYFSINVQFVATYSLEITNVVGRWQGSVHDSTIFDMCKLHAEFETGLIPCGSLVGDSGYPCSNYLLTPIENPKTNAEERYNETHKGARNCVERANGAVKRRFPILKYGICQKLKNISPIIPAVVVLHNIAITVGEDEPPEDKELFLFIQEKKRRGAVVDYDDVPVPAFGIVADGNMQQSIIH